MLDTNTYIVEVKAGQQVSKTVPNGKPEGTFTLIKKNSDKSSNIKGTKYRIWNNEGYDKEFVTDGEGKIEATGLTLGRYYYQEIQASYGYLIDNEVYSFDLDYKDQSTRIIYASSEKTNEEPTGELTIEKTDKETGNQNRSDEKSHHGDAKLTGTTYTLYARNDIYNVSRSNKYFSKDQQIATFTFNDYGVASINIIANNTKSKINVKETVLCGIPMGSYYLKETIVPTRIHSRHQNIQL